MKRERAKPKASAGPAPPPSPPAPPVVFACLAAVFFFVVLIKFGDPVIVPTDSLAPGSLNEAIFGPWPTHWDYWALAPLVVLSIFFVHWKASVPRRAMFLLVAWLFWQFVSALQTEDGRLSTLAIQHFSACVALFFLGYYGLNRWENPWPVWAGLGLALCWIMRDGFQQHFGGLEATRQYIKAQHGAQWAEFAAQNPDFVRRIETNRIFATFVQPNALAGCVLFLMPMTVVFVWRLTPKVSRPVRSAFIAILAAAGLATLYWSGSKAGWLVALAMGVFALTQAGLSAKWRLGLIAALCALGVAGFALRYSHYFERGATSAVARFDYWKAALQVINHHPALGTGPGTFSRPYAQLKDPKSEMARLCHNDYLEQASDSGLPGAAAYGAFFVATAMAFWRFHRAPATPKDSLRSAVFLGLAGLAVHSFVEYHLYIPALSWPYFFLLGWAWSLI